VRVLNSPVVILLTVASCLMAPPVGSIAPDEPTDDGWSAEALGAAREQLTDLLARPAVGLRVGAVVVLQREGVSREPACHLKGATSKKVVAINGICSHESTFIPNLLKPIVQNCL